MSVNSISAEAVLKIASAEIGYREKATNYLLDNPTANAGSSNWTKYARDLSQAGYYNGNKNGYAWCDVFVDWCFYQASGKNRTLAEKVQCQSGDLGAGCLYSAQYYKSAGRWSTRPSVGAQIFFTYRAGEVSHTGIVESFNSSTVTTIEGNTSEMVARRTYPINSGNIYGYGLPLYDTKITVTNSSSVSNITNTVIQKPQVLTSAIYLPELSTGDRNDSVKTLQLILIGEGFSVGSDGADGDFGLNTFNALKLYQAKNGLTTDGVVGINTWKKLLGVK